MSATLQRLKQEHHHNRAQAHVPGYQKTETLQKSLQYPNHEMLPLRSLRHSNDLPFGWLLLEATMRNNRNPEAGFGILLELLVAMAISSVLLAGSTVALHRVQATQNQLAAHTATASTSSAGASGSCDLCPNQRVCSECRG